MQTARIDHCDLSGRKTKGLIFDLNIEPSFKNKDDFDVFMPMKRKKFLDTRI